jgi:hypothetical protein
MRTPAALLLVQSCGEMKGRFMKNFSMLLAGMLLFSMAWTQNIHAAVVDDEYDNGGFGGALLQMTTILDHSAVLVGGRGGWIIDHRFILGGAGYGLASEIETDTRIDGREVSLQMAYGGLWLEYVLRPRKIIHFSVHALFGNGIAGLTFADTEKEIDHDHFFVIEPGLTMTLNVARFLRIGTGVCYRHVSGLDLAPLHNKDLAAPGWQIFINFGKF